MVFPESVNKHPNHIHYMDIFNGECKGNRYPHLGKLPWMICGQLVAPSIIFPEMKIKETLKPHHLYIYIKAAECHISHLPVDRNHIVWSIYTLIVFVCMERWFRAPRTTTLYPFSHNHGSKKWVPPIVVTFQIQFHFHYFLRKSTQHFVPHPNFLE